MSKKIDAQAIIEYFELEELPREGGMFIQSYCSEDILKIEHLPARYLETKKTGGKPAGTAIYYLLTDDQDSFSAMHRLPTDEVYHFYLGDPVEMLLLYPTGESRVVMLGQDILGEQHVQYVVQRGVWQGSHLAPGGSFALLGTTMAPGWTDDDYTEAGFKELVEKYPSQEDLIKKLTRTD